jgi:hypothetical protein
MWQLALMDYLGNNKGDPLMLERLTWCPKIEQCGLGLAVAKTESIVEYKVDRLSSLSLTTRD